MKKYKNKQVVSAFKITKISDFCLLGEIDKIKIDTRKTYCNEYGRKHQIPWSIGGYYVKEGEEEYFMDEDQFNEMFEESKENKKNEV